MTPPKINVQQNGNFIKYITQSECGATAELMIEKDGKVFIIRHTEVDPVFRGQGIGKLLIKAFVSDARADGLKIHPECSYAANQFQKNLEWSDLLVGT